MNGIHEENYFNYKRNCCSYFSLLPELSYGSTLRKSLYSNIDSNLLLWGF